MIKRMDVDWYIREKLVRIKYATDHEAHMKNYDHKAFNQYVINRVREERKFYSDDLGVQGFFKWLQGIILECSNEFPNRIIVVQNNTSDIITIPAEDWFEVPHTTAKPPKNLHPDPKQKWCVHHKAFHHVDEFYKNKNLADGYDTSCKACRIEKRKERVGATEPIPKKERKIYIPKPKPMITENERTERPATISDITFTNDELDEMVKYAENNKNSLAEKIIFYEVEIGKMKILIEKQDTLINKLKRRKK